MVSLRNGEVTFNRVLLFLWMLATVVAFWTSSMTPLVWSVEIQPYGLSLPERRRARSGANHITQSAQQPHTSTTQDQRHLNMT